MVLVQVFCFWFSVRLGSVIIGIFTLIQACLWLAFCLFWIGKPEEVSKEKDALEEVAKHDNILMDIAASKTYMSALAVLFTLLVFSSIVVVIGSFQCKPKLLYPFLLTYFLYVALMFGCHVLLIMHLKNEDYGLGQLILYSNIGGFLILYMSYLWACVFSFLQMILELRKELDQRKLIPTVQKVKGINILSGPIGRSYKY